MRESHKPDNLEYSRHLEQAKEYADKLRVLSGKIKVVKAKLEEARKDDEGHNYSVQDLKNRHIELLRLNTELETLNEEARELWALLQRQAIDHEAVDRFLKNFESEYIN
jgi:hypothetical protein